MASPQQLSLEVPTTDLRAYSTRFQGSKRRVLPWLLSRLTEAHPDGGYALDGFSGSGVVTYGLTRLGWQVTACDRLLSSYWTVRGFAGGSDLITEDLRNRIVHAAQDFDGGPIFEEYRGIFFLDDETRWLEGAAEEIRQLPEGDRGLPFWALFQSALAKRPYNLFHRANLDMRLREVKRSFGNKTTWEKPFTDHFAKFIKEANTFLIRSPQHAAEAIVGDPASLEDGFDLVYLDPPYVNGRGVGTPYEDFYGFLDLLCDPSLLDQLDRTKAHRPLSREKSDWERAATVRRAFHKVIAAHPGATIAISYRTHGTPSVQDLVSLLRRYRAEVSVFKTPIKYALSKNQKSEEVLLVGHSD